MKMITRSQFPARTEEHRAETVATKVQLAEATGVSPSAPLIGGRRGDRAG